MESSYSSKTESSGSYHSGHSSQQPSSYHSSPDHRSYSQPQAPGQKTGQAGSYPGGQGYPSHGSYDSYDSYYASQQAPASCSRQSTLVSSKYLNYPYASNDLVEHSIAAGIFGLIVTATGTMGARLHEVANGEMTMGKAVNDSLINGVKGGVATASAAAATKTVTNGGLLGLAVTLATATGVSYLLSK